MHYPLNSLIILILRNKNKNISEIIIDLILQQDFQVENKNS